MAKNNKLNRRDFIKASAFGAAGLAFSARNKTESLAQSGKGKLPIRIGMTDWNLRKRGEIEAIKLACEIGLDGVEISAGTRRVEDNLPNRVPERQELYRNACYKYGIMIPSVCIGEIGSLPLNSEPKAAIWVADVIEMTRNLGAKNILIPVLGSVKTEDDFKRLIAVLSELAPRAGDAGINLCLEAHLSPDDHLRIFREVNHPAVKAYYDPRNALVKGFDPLKGIPMLEGHIGQVHLKNGSRLLRNPDSENFMDFPAMAKLLKQQGYDGWLILETQSPNDLIEDTRDNIRYLREVFDIF